MNKTDVNNNADHPEKIRESSILFKYGLPGFESFTKFTLTDLEDYPSFYLLKSEDEENFSMLVLSLATLKVQEELEVLIDELKRRDIDFAKNAVYLILKLSQSEKKFTANIKAPIIIDTENHSGTQLILEHRDLSMEYILNNA